MNLKYNMDNWHWCKHTINLMNVDVICLPMLSKSEKISPLSKIAKVTNPRKLPLLLCKRFITFIPFSIISFRSLNELNFIPCGHWNYYHTITLFMNIEEDMYGCVISFLIFLELHHFSGLFYYLLFLDLAHFSYLLLL